MPVLPALSVAVTVIMWVPLNRRMLEAVQLVVPEAVPFPPALLDQVKFFIPDVASEALPLNEAEMLVVV